MSALKIKDDQGNWINLPGLKGDKGDKGDKGESGVYLGTTAPSDEDINVWINPNGEAYTEAVVVDPTLTMEGQAADAKVAGDEINDLKSDLNSVITPYLDYGDITAFVDTGYYPCAALGYTVPDTPTASSTFSNMVLPVKEGETYRLTGTGGQSARLYAFTDTAKKVISYSTANETAVDKIIKVKNDGYLYINANRTLPAKVEKAYLVAQSEFGMYYYDITDINPNGVYNGQQIGYFISDAPNTRSETYASQVVPVLKNDRFKITGKGATSYRLWAFTDTTKAIVKLAQGGVEETEKEIIAPEDGYLYFQPSKLQEYKIFKYGMGNIRRQMIVTPIDTITDFYNKFKVAYNMGNCDVYIRCGTYTLTNALIDSIMTAHNGNPCGIPIGRGCRYYFEPPARVYCEYTGENVLVKTRFSPFDTLSVGGDFEMHGLNLTAKNVRYAIHDEANSSIESSKHIYKNCNIALDNMAVGTDGFNLSKCIGGGLGAYEEIIIDNCEFSTVNLNPDYLGADVSYHDPANGSVCDAHIYIKASWFGNSFRSATYTNINAPYPEIIINNCSFGIENSYGINHVVKAWNNEFRDGQ